SRPGAPRPGPHRSADPPAFGLARGGLRSPPRGLGRHAISSAGERAGGAPRPGPRCVSTRPPPGLHRRAGDVAAPDEGGGGPRRPHHGVRPLPAGGPAALLRRGPAPGGTRGAPALSRNGAPRRGLRAWRPRESCLGPVERQWIWRARLPASSVKTGANSKPCSRSALTSLSVGGIVKAAEFV